MSATIDTSHLALLLNELRLPAIKHLWHQFADRSDKEVDNFNFAAVPVVSKAQVSALCDGDGWLDKGANLLLFGPPGDGKSHLAAAIGLSRVEKGWRVF